MFYDKYLRLCAEKGISPSAAAGEIGLRKSNVTYWKNGRNNPTDATLLKIADYFGVTVEYLKTCEEKAPTQSDDGSCEKLSTNEMTAEKSEILKKIQKMSSSEVRAVLAFVNALDSMNKEKGE